MTGAFHSVYVPIIAGMFCLCAAAFLAERRVLGRLRSRLWGAGRFALALLTVYAIRVGGSKVPGGGLRTPAQPDTNEIATVTIPETAYLAGFVRTEERFGETHDFTPPTGATVNALWRTRGASEDAALLSLPEPFPFAGKPVTNVFVFPRGVLSFRSPADYPPVQTNEDVRGVTALAPFHAALGLAPEYATAPAGMFWWYASSSNTLLFTWCDTLFGRDAGAPVSFQAELFPKGDFVYRYDLSLLTNRPLETATVGAWNAGVGNGFAPTSPALSSVWWRHLSTSDLADPDRDGDGIPTASELLVYHTDADNPDTDGDGMPDGWEVIYGLSPHDASDALSDVDADGIPNVAEFRLGLDPLVNERTTFWETDSPQEGTGYMLSFRLRDPPPCPVVIAVGKRRAVLADTYWHSFVVRRGYEYRITLAATDCPTGVSLRLECDADPASSILTDPQGICSSDGVSLAAPYGGYAEIAGSYCAPAVRITPPRACFHGDERVKTLRAEILPHGISGTFRWLYKETWRPSATLAVRRGDAPAWASVFFNGDAAHPLLTVGNGIGITACWIEDTPADTEDGLAENNDGGVPCAPGCACGCRLTGRCSCLEQVQAQNPMGGAGNSPGAGQEPDPPDEGGSEDSPILALAVNDDDDDGDGRTDLDETGGISGEDDLLRIPGLSDCGTPCCPCHPSSTVYAEVESYSPSLRLWADAGRSTAWQGGYVYAGTEIYAEGIVPSVSPGDQEVCWRVHRTDGTTDQVVTQFTVLGLRLFLDLDGDGEVTTNDVKRFGELDPSNGWTIPAIKGKRHAFLLRSGVALPGETTLSLDGPEGVFSLYADEEGGVPLAVSGGVSLSLQPSPGDTTWWLEAGTTAVCRVSVSYTGSGAAAGYSCSAELPVAAFRVFLYEIKVNENGEPLLDSEGNFQPGEELDIDSILSGYVPETERGSPAVQNLSTNVSAWCEFRASETDAVLTISSPYVDRMRGWTFGSPTNGVYRSELDDGWIAVEIQTNVEQSVVELVLLTASPELTGTTNPVPSRIPVVETTPNVWATRSFSGEREDIGMPPLCARNGFFIKTDGMPAPNYAEITMSDENEVILLDGEALANGDICIIPVIADSTWVPPDRRRGDKKFFIHWFNTDGYAPATTKELTIRHYSSSTKRSLSMTSGMPMLLSGMISDEPLCGQERGDKMGEAANVAHRMGIGVTPVFNPDKDTLSQNLKKNRIWIHYGHGHRNLGIQIAKRRVSNGWCTSLLTADDIRAMNIEHDYDLVFMNTCDSTDKSFAYILECGPASFREVPMTSHAVLDIGMALRAKNYIGWDCEVERELSSATPRRLLEALNQRCKNGSYPTVKQAVEKLKAEAKKQRYEFFWLMEKLRIVVDDESVRLGQSRKGKKK